MTIYIQYGALRAAQKEENDASAPSKPEVKLSGPAEYYNMCQKCVI